MLHQIFFSGHLEWQLISPRLLIRRCWRDLFEQTDSGAGNFLNAYNHDSYNNKHVHKLMGFWAVWGWAMAIKVS